MIGSLLSDLTTPVVAQGYGEENSALSERREALKEAMGKANGYSYKSFEPSANRKGNHLDTHHLGVGNISFNSTRVGS